MKKKTIGILLMISLVMIISISAISASYANETLQGEVSDTNIELAQEVDDTNIESASPALEQSVNTTSQASESGNDLEKLSEDDSRDENHKVGDASSASDDVLSASNDDLLGENPNFYYNGEWYEDLDDAVDDACDNDGGTIYLKPRAWGYDSAERQITISKGVTITFQPYYSSGEVIFDGQSNTYWFFKINDKNAHVTFNNITFRNGGDGSLASDGGAIRIIHGSVTFNNCIFDNNKACSNVAGGYGWGGAIFLDEDDASLIANNCRFTNNNADNGGGAVFVEDGATATFTDCYFEGNKAGGYEDHVQDEAGSLSSHSFSNCLFKGSGSLDIKVDAPAKTVYITPYVDEEVNYAVLYKNGEEYDRTACNNGDTASFDDLEKGIYTVYMMKNWESKYEYSGNTFSITESFFILDGETVFENLSAAVNAIPSGGSGVITVEGGIYTGSANFMVSFSNKNVTIMPKKYSPLNPVIFSPSSQQNYLFAVMQGSQLTMEYITMEGRFSVPLSIQTNLVCTISNCEFNNIRPYGDEPGQTIFARNANLVLESNTFESSGQMDLGNTVVNIDDCTFTSNTYYNGLGGAIYADSSSNVTITNSEFTDNIAPSKGGAIYASNLKLDNTEFIGNGAGLGGAIYIAGDSNDSVEIIRCAFDANYATDGYRNIYFESATRNISLMFNEFDLNLKIDQKDGSYGMDYILEGVFEWGCNLDDNYTFLAGIIDDENLFDELVSIKDNKFNISIGVLSAGTHEFAMEGMFIQGDTNDHFYARSYYSDLYGNEFYLNKGEYAKILIDKAKITLALEVNNVLIPEIPVLNVYANWDLNYTVFVGNKYYTVKVVNGKGSMQLTGLDLGNHTVIVIRDGDENFNLAINFTTFTISKTYSNFLVLSTNVEYDTLNEAVANSNDGDVIYIKKGTYSNTGILISNKTVDIIALKGAVFDAQGKDANFIIVDKNSEVYIYGITFTGIHNRNTNYGAIVNHGYLTVESCNFTDNEITKTTFAQNGGAAIFSDGESLDIDSCNFINNVAPLKVSTAAVTSVGYEDVSIESSKFINNSAREGGAVYFKNLIQYTDAIYLCDFVQNVAVKGSAIYVGNNSRYVSVGLSNFKKNDIKNSLGENAQLEGGVIYVNAYGGDTVLNVDSSNFEDNSNSNVDGGVIFLDGNSKAVIDNSVFTNNRGKLGSVILIKNPYDKKLTLFIEGSNFINNNATNGTIVTSPKVTAFIDECLFANNTGENRNIYSNGFTVVHDSILDVKGAELNALSVLYGEHAVITGTADIGANINAAVNLTVADENIVVDIKNNSFTYDAGILNHGKYHAVLNGIQDANGNTYLMDSITGNFRVNRVALEFNVSVDNITYGETLKVVEKLPSDVMGTIYYLLNGDYYTKDEVESLILDAGKYTLVAVYDYDDFAFSTAIANFEVSKADPTISVADVEVGYGDTIILNIETNVPSIYIIEIENYRTVTFINASKSIEIENTFEPGNYTINVTSQERVNYKSNSTEANLKVNIPAPIMLGASNNVPDESLMSPLSVVQYAGDDSALNEENLNILKSNVKGDLLTFSGNDILEEEQGNFIYQYSEDDERYSYFDTLEDAVNEAILYGAGIITVRGGTYFVSSMDIEGPVELTIRAYEDEEVIFDCGGAYYFMLLTYEVEMEWVEVPPPGHPEFEQTEGPTVTLENITVMNGVATYGGAIDLEAGTLTLMGCNFTNNQAVNGGAIYIGKSDAEYDATLIGLNTTFTNNSAESEGGAIYIASDNLDGQTTSASFMSSTFLDNYQGEGDERIRNYFAGGNVDEIICQYCVFNANGNISDYQIDKINQTVYVKGNSTDTFDSVVLLYGDQLPLYTINNYGAREFNVTFKDVMGGNYTVGVMNDHHSNTYIFDLKFEVIVPNFIISDDEVFENLTDAIEAVAENGVIYANVNYYHEDNMQIDIRKSFTLKNFKDDGVVFDGSSALWFFTIAEGYAVVFDGISFSDGGIKNYASIENYGNLIITNCSFDSFETGAIIYNSGLINILNSTFSLNSVDKAIVWNEGELLIDTVEFSSNIVNINSAVYNNGDAEIKSSNFTDNYNGGNGGAVYNKNSLLITDTVFSENEAIDGGAVYNEGTLNVFNSSFEDNTANGYAGAIFNDGNEANIYNSSFTGGASEKDGGAIYNNNAMTVDNSTFLGNSATGIGGAIYNNKTLAVTKSFFHINYADEFANIFNAGNIQFNENTFDFYDVILIVPDGQYGIPTTIAGTLDPQFNMDLQVTLPGFVNNTDADVIISEGVFEYVTDILPKGSYDVNLNEIIYDNYGNIYIGESVFYRLIVHKADVCIDMTVDDIILKGGSHNAPVLIINVSQNGEIRIIFNNNISTFNITEGYAEITLDKVDEGNYTVFAFREGDENYNDAVNTTSFTVKQYEGNFIVNSTGGHFDTLREAIENSSDEDIIYAVEGNYTGADNLNLTVSGKKLSIVALGDVVFYANSTRLNFLTVDETSDVTISDVVITGFDAINQKAVIVNRGNLTFDGVSISNNNLSAMPSEGKSVISNEGNLNIVGSGFYDNIISYAALIRSSSNIIVNESRFENNTLNGMSIIFINNANSAKIISNVFAENSVRSKVHNIIGVFDSKDILISSEFYNNVLNGEIIYANRNNTLLVNNSIFTGNKAKQIISSESNQITISESLFADNTVENVVLSTGENLSVRESVFSANTLSGNGTLSIGSGVNATINGSTFLHNNADNYRNIYSVGTVNISNTTFDAINVDFTVHDIDYGQDETINGTIDIGTNFQFTVNFDISSKIYSVNVTDSKFTLNAGILDGGDHNVVLNPKDNDLNTFVFNKITKLFTVNRIDPGLSVSIPDITWGEKLNVTLKINKSATARVVYELDGKVYNKAQLENLTLAHGNYLIVAMYGGDKNYLPDNEIISVKVNKIAPNITVSDLSVSYGDEVKINVTVDVADYYTVFLGNESVSLYVEDNAIFTFPSEDLEPGSYPITVYVFESDDYAEAYAYANLTVNKAAGFFKLSNDYIIEGENATVRVTVPVNAYGNITYKVYDNKSMELVYTITQSCLEELVVPNLDEGKYRVTGTYGGDSYYTSESRVNTCSIQVVEPTPINVSVSVDDIAYGEIAVVIVKSDADGRYLVYVDDTPYTVNVAHGIGNTTVSALRVGSHVANVTTLNKFNTGFNSTTFEVSKAKTEIDINLENLTGSTPVISIALPTEAGGNISLYVNSVLSQITNLVNGSAVIIVPNLVAGKNNITVVYSGDDNYGPVSKSVIVDHNATIIASDMTRGYNSGMDYTAKLLDGNESPLANTAITVKVDTKNYTVTTDSNGVFILNVKLAPGNHAIAIVNPATGEYKLTNLKIVGRITGNKDVKIFFADKSNYKVRIIGDGGNYVGAGEVVKINVGGKTYSVKTDKNGYANLKLSLKVKKHTITVTYKGFTTKNKVTVKSVVKPVKKTVKVKKTAKKLKIKVKLKGKKVLKKKRVYMKFKGKKYKAKTNKKGIATFKVPKKVIKKLKKGKKYKATFTYKAKANGKTIKNTAKCYVKAR